MRTEIQMTDKQIEDSFEPETCPGIEEVKFTRDTLDNFEAAAAGYAEHGAIRRTGSKLVIEAAQVRKGDRRRDIIVVDFGSVRGVA